MGAAKAVLQLDNEAGGGEAGKVVEEEIFVEGAIVEEGQPQHKHTVDFSLTLEDMSLVAFDTRMQYHFVSDLATNLGVESHDVEIIRYAAGSVVVQTRIWGSGSAERAQELAVRVRHKAVAGVLLRHRFGPCAVHGVCIEEELRDEDEGDGEGERQKEEVVAEDEAPRDEGEGEGEGERKEGQTIAKNESERLSSDLGAGSQAGKEPSGELLGKSEDGPEASEEHEHEDEIEHEHEIKHEHEHEHHVEFSLVLHDQDLVNFHGGQQEALLEILRGHLGEHLDGHVIEIDGMEMGSLVVRLRVRHPPGSEDHHAEKTVDLLSDHSALSEKLVSWEGS